MGATGCRAERPAVRGQHWSVHPLAAEVDDAEMPTAARPRHTSLFR